MTSRLHIKGSGDHEREKEGTSILEMIIKYVEIIGENSQIPYFGKICDKLALFRKYLVMYHFFCTWVSQNWVLNSTRVS